MRLKHVLATTIAAGGVAGLVLGLVLPASAAAHPRFRPGIRSGTEYIHVWNPSSTSQALSVDLSGLQTASGGYFTSPSSTSATANFAGAAISVGHDQILPPVKHGCTEFRHQTGSWSLSNGTGTLYGLRVPNGWFTSWTLLKFHRLPSGLCNFGGSPYWAEISVWGHGDATLGVRYHRPGLPFPRTPYPAETPAGSPAPSPSITLPGHHYGD